MLWDPRELAEAQPTKVVVIGSFTPSLVNFRGPLLRALVERGHEVVAFGPERDPPTEAALDAMGVRFVPIELDRTGLNPARDLWHAFRLLRRLREERPGAVLAYTIKPVVYATPCAWMLRVPRRAAMIEGIGYAFGTTNVRQRLVGRIATWLYRIGLGSANTVFFLNPDDREEFVERRLVARAKTLVIAGTGVDLDHYTRADPPVTDGPVFLLIARLLKEKGITVFVDAARMVRERFPNARFQVLGPFDPHPDAITREQVDTWQEEGVIEYLGVTKDVRPYLAKCSAFVLPSYYREGLPRTALEALATGRPIITTDAPGCREAVADGVNGWLVPPRDPVALAKAMMRLLDTPDAITTMGRASAELAQRRFDVRRVNQDVIGAMAL